MCDDIISVLVLIGILVYVICSMRRMLCFAPNQSKVELDCLSSYEILHKKLYIFFMYLYENLIFILIRFIHIVCTDVQFYDSKNYQITVKRFKSLVLVYTCV